MEGGSRCGPETENGQELASGTGVSEQKEGDQKQKEEVVAGSRGGDAETVTGD